MAKKDALAGVEGHKGSRLDRPHSPKGWTSNRDTEASAPLQMPPPDSDSGWSATGRAKS